MAYDGPMRSHHVLAIALSWSMLGCSDDGGTGGAGANGGGGASEGGGGAGPSLDFVAGGDRPVTVRVPPDYDDDVATPLVILLHGYGANGGLEDFFLKMSDAAMERGVVFAAPDGTPDMLDRPFWNATDACCNFDGIEVDDVTYLIGLVDEISATLNIDPKRVYFAGHSNGGFMSHRLACDRPEKIAAIAVLAGAMHNDPTECGAPEPVTLLQIHGTADDTIHYDGGDLFGNPYPSVAVTVGTWVDIDGCDPTPASDGSMDLDTLVDGAETTVSRYGGCESNTEIELWTMDGSGHIPGFDTTIGGRMLDFLLAHSK
jgi:polyhydroxybutyrate depolymerase